MNEQENGHLYLTRRVGESIVINGNIVVTVVDIRHGGKVRLGFEAPRDIPIYRDDARKKS